MLATFANRLKPKQVVSSDEVKIFFAHSFRCSVEVWFEETTENQYGWVLQFKSNSDALLNEFRGPIFKQVVRYLEMRSRLKITDISFTEIEKMAQALEIKTVANMVAH